MHEPSIGHSCCWIWCTSIMFLLVRDSCGSLYSVYLRRTLSISVLAYWYSLLLLLKIMRAISQSHNTDNSYAFFITPNFRLLNVTWKMLTFIVLLHVIYERLFGRFGIDNVPGGKLCVVIMYLQLWNDNISKCTCLATNDWR